jgi:hypothetical protein
MSRSLGIGIAVLALITVGAYTLLESGETRDEYYASLREAEAMVAGGWIPNCLPASVSHIRVRSNIDTSVVFGQFRFLSTERAALRKSIVPQEGDLWPLPNGRPGVPSWWPKALVTNWNTATIRSSGYEIARCEGTVPFAILINWTEGRALFWNTGK